MSALYASSVTLAVIFAARRFFTSASFGRNKGRYSLKIPRVSKISYLFGMVNFMLILRMIMAPDADAILVAQSPFRKALAVKFQAIYLATLAPRVLVILIDHMMVVGRGACALMRALLIVLVQELIKEVFFDEASGIFLVDFMQNWHDEGFNHRLFFAMFAMHTFF